jgi:hypothetical protein
MRGEVVEESMQLTLVQLCHACDAEPDAVVELVAHGVLDPQGADPSIVSSLETACAAPRPPADS